MKSGGRMLMSTGGRFFSCSGPIFLTDGASDLGREDKEDDVSILEKMMWRRRM